VRHHTKCPGPLGGLFAVLLAWSGLAAGAAPPGTVLITGAAHGIGLEFARQYAALGWRVIATVRDASDAQAIQELAREHPAVSVETMDVTDARSVAATAARHKGEPIDLLINNAAFLAPRQAQQFGHFDYGLFEKSYAVNAIGPMRVTEAFIGNVEAGKGHRILTLTSAAGSVGLLNPPANLYPYRSSKAALNLLMRNLALELAPRGIIVGLVNPGLVDTRGILALKPGDMVPDEFAPLMPLIRSGALQLITPEVSVKAMIGLISAMPPEDSGRLLNYDGTPMPW
jgi:NAD(P)-dependent dehydrogenase (short-subunit alcohol dehydrogenase family)